MSKAEEVTADLYDFFREQIDGDDPVEEVAQIATHALEVVFESGTEVFVEVSDSY